jgi:hypothetical protein
MIHEVGVEVAAYMASKGCPFQVIDGPERETNTYARERVVIEHDPQGDGFADRHRTDSNPRTRLTRNIGVKVTIYAKNPRTGAPFWEHARRAEHVLDMVLIAFSIVAKKRQNLCVFRSGKFVDPPDLKDSETPGGAKYELYLTFDRGVADRNWDGTSQPTATITAVAPQTGSGVVIQNVGTVEDDSSSTEPI